MICKIICLVIIIMAQETFRQVINMNDVDLNIFFSSTNIAENLDNKLLDDIGQKIRKDYDIDKKSREEWEQRNREAIKLAAQIYEKKNFPFENAANIKFPILTIAIIQFAARAYPSLIRGRNIVKAKVTGSDPDGAKAGKAQRVATHMNYQLLEEMEEWEEDTDVLLFILALLGCGFKKTYFDSALGRNVSEFINPKDFVVYYYTKNLEKAPRSTHKYRITPNEIVEKVRSGIFRDIEYGSANVVKESDDEDEQQSPEEEDASHLFLEQHTFWDLDDDGYKEPYIITLHAETDKVVRIVARWDAEGIQTNAKGQISRIQPVQYFTKFPFMPAIDGGFYGLGFGSLLSPINETVNTTINQLLDAGTSDNAGGGFLGKGVNLPSGNLYFQLGEWKKLNYSGDDIRKAIVPKPKIEPSQVLYMLLGTMLEASDKLSSVADVLTGEQPRANMPATSVLALIEQGLKVFSSIHKRLHRSLKYEFRKLFRLNSLFLEEDTYFTVMDEEKAVKRSDYDLKSLDVQPVSEPTEISDTQRIMKAQALMGYLGMGYNDNEIRRRNLEALQIPDYAEIMQGPEKQPPDPKTMLELQKLELERDRFELDIAEAQGRIRKAEAEAIKARADAIKAIAEAESKEPGQNLEYYKANIDLLKEEIKAEKGKEANARNSSK